MFIKFFLLFVFLYNNYLFAESYIQNLEIIKTDITINSGNTLGFIDSILSPLI